MENVLVSVVLPMFNGADYIEEALLSLLSQDVNLEIVVSDNCSTDNSVGIVEKYLDTGKVVLLTSEHNAGIYPNLNKAIRKAKGDYIQFFSHDDTVLPGFLLSQVNLLESDSDIGLVYSECNIIDENGMLTFVAKNDDVPVVLSLEDYVDAAMNVRHACIPGSISTVMIKRKVIEMVGLLNEEMKISGDYEFYNRVSEHFKVIRNRDILLNVRIHQKAATNNINTPILNMKEENSLILPFYEKNMSKGKYKKMMRHRAKNRGADHALFLVKVLFKGRVKTFIEGCDALSKKHNLLLCFFFAIYNRTFSR